MKMGKRHCRGNAAKWFCAVLFGRVLGVVYATVPAASYREALASGPVVTAPRRKDASGTVDINLHLVATGNAHHYSHFDKMPAYIAVESPLRKC